MWKVQENYYKYGNYGRFHRELRGISSSKAFAGIAKFLFQSSFTSLCDTRTSLMNAAVKLQKSLIKTSNFIAYAGAAILNKLHKVIKV